MELWPNYTGVVLKAHVIDDKCHISDGTLTVIRALKQEMGEGFPNWKCTRTYEQMKREQTPIQASVFQESGAMYLTFAIVRIVCRRIKRAFASICGICADSVVLGLGVSHLAWIHLWRLRVSEHNLVNLLPNIRVLDIIYIESETN